VTLAVVTMPDVVTPEDGTAAAALHEALLARGQTVGTAESLTGGALGDLLSSTPGASATYRGGVVTYATELKQSLLRVGDDLVATYGVVSGECARAMADGARTLLGSDWAVSTTGVAGPDLQEGKPAGTVHVGVAGPTGTTSVALRLDGERRAVREETCRRAVAALLDAVVGAGR
jgi:nicotinamide-nucleotide amidase